MGKQFWSTVALCALVGVVALIGASSAAAAFPGTNGKIAFAHNPGNDIFTMDTNGQNPTQLTSGPEFDAEPTWSADGEKIAFTRKMDGMNREIWVMNFDGSGQTQITANPAFDDSDPYF
ncbi:MAG TPA: hypothetical protein VEK39_05720, partial [Solirubrobacterales bacterium]|nr:hypothetical protein [Solirubrobacterales bacterium]